jgi:hypothetical protein
MRKNGHALLVRQNICAFQHCEDCKYLSIRHIMCFWSSTDLFLLVFHSFWVLLSASEKGLELWSLVGITVLIWIGNSFLGMFYLGNLEGGFGSGQNCEFLWSKKMVFRGGNDEKWQFLKILKNLDCIKMLF